MVKERWKHGASFNKHKKKINACTGISIGGKTNIYFRKYDKRALVKIMEKHLNEMEWMAEKLN